MITEKRLYRDEFHKKVGGVCAGLAEYLAVDVAIVRVLFVLAVVLHGSGLLIYVVLWIALPKRPFIYTDPTVDYKVPPQGAEGTIPPGGSPFGAPFQANQFGSNPFPNTPMPSKQSGTSIVAMIFGVILIFVGGTILLDNLNIMPDWDFWKLSPVILIIIGCGIMLSGNKKKPEAAWQAPKDAEATTDTSETNPPADNPPAV